MNQVPMNVTHLALPGALLIAPRRFPDHRGVFWESWNDERYREAGIPGPFVQDNAAVSVAGVIRGLHYQWPNPQGKLVQVVEGSVVDVIVDLRRGSPTFGEWLAETLDADSGRQLWVPEGFAHGYAVTSPRAVLLYKCTRAYDPSADRAVRYNDPTLGVEWPVTDPILSEKDRAAPLLADVSAETLPTFGPKASGGHIEDGEVPEGGV